MHVQTSVHVIEACLVMHSELIASSFKNKSRDISSPLRSLDRRSHFRSRHIIMRVEKESMKSGATIKLADYLTGES
jgi:hypothetical protein